MTASKIVAAAASGAGGGATLDVDEVFSTFLYEGTGSAQTITNNIDLSGEGGLVWIKGRSSKNHRLFDTGRGVSSGYISSNLTNAANFESDQLTAFNSNGFSIGGNPDVNHASSGYTKFVSWTFRKAPKFFDVVTWTGNGVNGRTISHNLGSTPGMILVKSTGHSDGWITYHRGMDASSPQNYAMFLNLTNARATETYWNNTAPTSTGFTVSSNVKLNGSSGQTYVAYLFAHNNNDGEFGPDSDQDIIKCGSYTGTGAKLDINIGFEAQWVMIKQTDASRDWHLFDVMRGMPVGSDASWLEANTSDSEANNAYMSAHPTGFTLPDGHPEVCANGGNYIYMAIRRGPLAAPDDATKVFAIGERGQNSPPPAYQAGFTVDMFTNRSDVTLSSQWYTYDRLRGRVETLFLDATTAEQAYGGTAYAFDQMDGIGSSTNSDVNNFSWMWKRAPGYFDIACYQGTGSNRTVTHNLGAVPEMMWIKNRDVSESWIVYHKDVGATKYLMVDQTNAEITNSTRFNDTSPTASVFTVGTDRSVNSSSSHNHIAYLFATVSGVSKVGSFSPTGSTLNVDCGFSNSARFVLVKRTDSTGEWYVWDSVRGIVSGNDPYLYLNSTGAETTNADYIDPHSSGFTITSAFFGSGNFIFYAIA